MKLKNITVYQKPKTIQYLIPLNNNNNNVLYNYAICNYVLFSFSIESTLKISLAHFTKHNQQIVNKIFQNSNFIITTMTPYRFQQTRGYIECHGYCYLEDVSFLFFYCFYANLTCTINKKY